MSSRTIHLSDAFETQLLIEAAEQGTTPGRLLTRLATAAMCGTTPPTMLVSARVVKAIREGKLTIETIAKATGLKTRLVDETLRNLCELPGGVKLVNEDGRAVWRLAAA